MPFLSNEDSRIQAAMTKETGVPLLHSWEVKRLCRIQLPLTGSPQTQLSLAALWLALRILSGFWAALASTIRPLTTQELAIALWPPSLPIDAWLYRTLLAPWQRWDVSYYLAIVTRGYSTGDGTTQFHPLYPLLAIPLARLGVSPLLSLLCVSSAAGFLLYLAFARLAALDLPPSEARLSVLFLALAPPAFILFAPYTEALFLLSAVLCLWYARQRQWWQAALAGALATLTRQQGIFLVLPLAWELWEAAGRDWRQAVANRRGLGCAGAATPRTVELAGLPFHRPGRCQASNRQSPGPHLFAVDLSRRPARWFQCRPSYGPGRPFHCSHEDDISARIRPRSRPRPGPDCSSCCWSWPGAI